MQQVLQSWAILTISFWLASAILPGVHIHSIKDAVVVAGVFGLVNLLLGKVMFALIGVGTLGVTFLFSFLGRWLVDTVLLRLVGRLSPRLTISSFSTAMACAFVMSLFGTSMQALLF